MFPILYLLLGLALGGSAGYLLSRLGFLRNYLSRTVVARDYVYRELYENVHEQLRVAGETLRRETEQVSALRGEVLALTAEVNVRLTRAEVDRSYVAAEAYDLVRDKLAEAEQGLTRDAGEILRLSQQVREYEQQQRHMEEKLTGFRDELGRLHELSHEQFRNIAARILEDRQQSFVTTNKKEMQDILEPFRSGLQEFRQKVEDTRKEDIADLTSLKKEIEALRTMNLALSEDARSLALALKSEVKVQGSWGEDRLNMILEAEGLQKYIDYTREEVFRDTEQDRLRRPDYVLRLPGGKHIVIDSKVSLTAYVNYFNATNPEEKTGWLRQHLRSVTDHINSLADKNYQSLAGLNTPDYVFLFMPIESALTLAMNQSGDLFTHALNRKIVLITPTTLVATLKVVRLLWQKENQVKNVEEIFRQCGALYDRFVDFIGDMDRIGVALEGATGAWHGAMNKLKTGERKGYTMIGRFQRIKDLEAKVSKTLPAEHVPDGEEGNEEEG